MSFWPFHSGEKRIQDLKAPELVAIATTKLKTLGRNTHSMRLIYRALSLDPFQPQALVTLSDIYRGKTKGARPVGDEIYAGIVLEFAVGDTSPFSAEQKRLFEKCRTEIMMLWGFAKLHGEDLDVDHLGYMTFINQIRSQIQSDSHGFGMALLKLGMNYGLLDPASGKETRMYTDWLRSEASTLKV